MTTISLRVNDDESKLIHDYVSVNQLNMSQFIRDAVLDKIGCIKFHYNLFFYIFHHFLTVFFDKPVSLTH